MAPSASGPIVTVVVGVDGAGRTHRLSEIVRATGARDAVWIEPPLGTLADLQAVLDKARADASLVLVDNAHRLGGDELLALAAAVREGVRMTISRRPTIDRREVAELDEAVAGRGAVEQLLPLDVDGVAALITRVTGRAPSPETSAVVHTASAGMPAVAAAIADTVGDQPAPALVARVQRRLAVLEPATAAVARVLALRLDVGDDVLGRAAGHDGETLAQSMRTLRDAGLLVPGDERMIPAVADAVLADLPAAERRRLHDAVAGALGSAGSDLLVAATQLRAARAFTLAAAEVYRGAGDRQRFVDPAAAVSWYDDAVDAGADPASVAVGRAEAAVLIGLPFDPGPAVPADQAGRLALAEGAATAHQGRAARAADILVRAVAPGPVLAVPALMATARPDDARAAATTPSAMPALRLFADAALAVRDPTASVPLLIEAVEATEGLARTVILPDTPHALAAMIAVTAGDSATAEHALERAAAEGPANIGGPVAAERHRLLLAWVRMRVGRYDTAVAELRRLGEVQLPGRERLLRAAVAAGIARRSGDIARLRDAWTEAEPALARRAVDLFTVEIAEELLVAAVRLRRPQHVAPVLDTLDQILGGLGRPPAWAVSVGWIRLQLAVAAEDADAAAAAAFELDQIGAPGGRQRAQCAAADRWARAVAGHVDPDGVMAAADGLVEGELPWEASRLVGHAAIRTTDASAARRMLERARELSSLDIAASEGRSETSLGGLSEREVEVARLVLDGATYREIGSRLFISPKTVEHHVARIRTKLGATTRAEFVASLRTLFEASDLDS